MSSVKTKEQKYEVVCSEHCYDVGLLIEKDYNSKPKRIRAKNYGSPKAEYGGVELINWINTGVFLSEKEWDEITYKKSTSRVLDYLGIERKTTMAKKVINGLEVNGENIITSLKIIKQVGESIVELQCEPSKEIESFLISKITHLKRIHF